MSTIAAIYAVSEIMDIQQNQTKVDSQMAATADEYATTIVSADNQSTQAMSAVVSDQNTTDSTTTNNNMVEAQQVQSTYTTEFQAQQKDASSIGTVFTNLTSGPDSNNMKTDGSVGNMFLQILSKVSSMLGSSY